MTERSCWYLVCEAGSRAPLVDGMEREARPVGVEGAPGLERPRSRAEVGVLDLLLKSFLPPLTLVRLVPAAASSCCWAGVRPDTPLEESLPVDIPVMLDMLEDPIRLARSCCC